jgi:HAD superfamily hydrolase (TIGR01509 family)
MIKAVIFDQDGVIIDSESFHVECERVIFDRYHLDVSKEEHLSFKGLSAKTIFERALKGKDIGRTIDELIDEKRKLWNTNGDQKLRIYDGFYKLVEKLKPDYVLALTTSAGRKTREYIKNLFPEQKGIFKVEITADDVIHSKPNPEPYLITAEQLEINPMYCVVIEDSINGIISAKNAGMKVIAITTGYPRDKLKEYSPNHIIDSLSEIDKNLIE